MNPALPAPDPATVDAAQEAPPGAGSGFLDSLDPDTIIELIEKYGLRVIGVFVLLFAAWILAGWVRRATEKACLRARIEVTLAKFFGNLARWGVLMLALIAILGMFGVETTSFAAVIAAMGFAIGMALQGTLGNAAAGVMLLIFRPFKVGDVVNISGEVGKVYEIELFTTRIDTADNRRIILPNGSVFGQKIENITFHDRRRVDVAVGVEYSADIDQTRDVLFEAARSLPGILTDPEPAVILQELANSSVNWSVRVWAPTSDYWPMRDALTRAVKMQLDQAEIGIPFPQMDVHLDK